MGLAESSRVCCLRVGRQSATTARHLDWVIGEIGQLLIEEEVDQGRAIVEFLRRQWSTLRDVVPIFEAGPAACRGRVLRVIDRIAFERRLMTVAGRFGDREILLRRRSRAASFSATRPLRWAWRIARSSTAVEKMMAYQFVLKRFEGMCRIGLVTAM